MRKNVLITGASSGIGAAFAEVATRNGNDVILVARRKDKLEKLAKSLEKECGIKTKIIVSDLTKPGEPKRVFNSAIKSMESVDVLINNAGFGDYGVFTASDTARNSEMIDLNCRVLTEFAQIAGKTMSAQGKGYICNVASTAGFIPGPYMSVYYATKAYVLSFSQAIGHELKDKNVSVTALCPGPTRTEFEKNAHISNKGIFSNSRSLPTAEQVAEFGWKTMLIGKPIAVYGMFNRIGISLVKLLPRNVVTKLIGNYQKNDL